MTFWKRKLERLKRSGVGRGQGKEDSMTTWGKEFSEHLKPFFYFLYNSGYMTVFVKAHRMHNSRHEAE